jgi:hypothetical protein
MEIIISVDHSYNGDELRSLVMSTMVGMASLEAYQDAQDQVLISGTDHDDASIIWMVFVGDDDRRIHYDH